MVGQGGFRDGLNLLETQPIQSSVPRIWGFGNIGTESPVKPSSATIAALYELFLVNNRIAQWSQFGVLAANVRKIYSSVLYAMLTGQLARPITALSAAHLTIAE